MVEEYAPEIRYIKGKENTIADTLSRLPMIEKGFTDKEELSLLMALPEAEYEPLKLETIAEFQKKDQEIRRLFQQKKILYKEMSGEPLYMTNENKIYKKLLQLYFMIIYYIQENQDYITL